MTAIFIASAIPIYFYLTRFLIPDFSFDTVNYHLFIGNRGLGDFFLPFGKNEFFPTGLHSFSAFFDTFFSITRHLLGYRLGTLPGLLAYLIVIYYVYKVVKYIIPYFLTKPLLVLAFINAIIVFELLAQVGTYFIDIVSAAFLMSGFYYFILYIREKRQLSLYISSALFGFALFGKLTNLVYIVPFLAFLVIYNLKRKKIKAMFASVILCLLPTVIYSLLLFSLTGNPVFPFFNSVFRSQYFSNVSFVNSFFGPKNLPEGLMWPLFTIKNHERLGELEALFYDKKLTIYFFIAVIYLLYNLLTKNNQGKWRYAIIGFFFIAYYLWVFAFGYLRYAVFLELIGSLIFILLINDFSDKKTLLKVVPIFLLLILLIQDYKILRISPRIEYAWRSPISLNVKQVSILTPNLFADKVQLPKDVEKLINQSDVYVNCGLPGTGLYTFLNIDKPVILLPGANSDYNMTKKYYEKEYTLANLNNKKTIRFTAMTMENGSNPNDAACTKTLGNSRYKIFQKYHYTSIIGDKKSGFLYFGTIESLDY